MLASNPNKAHWLSKSGFGDIHIWSVINSLSGVSRCPVLHLSRKDLVIQQPYTCEQLPLNLTSKSNNFKYKGNLSYHLLPHHLYKIKLFLHLFIYLFAFCVCVWTYLVQKDGLQELVLRLSDWNTACFTFHFTASSPHSFTKVVSFRSQTAITSYQQHRTLPYNTLTSYLEQSQTEELVLKEWWKMCF